MAAAAISAGTDVNLKTPPLPLNPARTPTTKRSIIFCNSAKSSRRHSSLSEQLKPLSTTLLSPPKTDPPYTLPPVPKSIWVNPAKPRRSVLSLQRHRRSIHSSPSPRFSDLKLFARMLSECDESDAAFYGALEAIPRPVTREDVVLILRSFNSWQRAHKFLNWIKTQDFLPMETLFYNLTLKCLRNGKQFEVMEELAHEMVANGIELDNITYSTIITCAKRCGRSDKAVEWFERMYKTGLMPDEVTYSAVLDVYAKLGKVEEAMSFYDRGRASGWRPDPIAFSTLGKMFGEARDYDGINFVLQEMKDLGVRPNLILYNTLLEAMGKAGKPGMARSLFREMVDSGVSPSVITLTVLAKLYGRARWARDALELWEKIKSYGWPSDMILYNTLLSMCAEIGLEAEAEMFLKEMKCSEKFGPDGWSYAAMLNMYGSAGKVEKVMRVFEEMTKSGVALNMIGCTSLIQCLGRANRIDESVKVFHMSIERGMKPDDKLCGCLLSIVALCNEIEDADKLLGCLEQANSKLSVFVKLLEEGETRFETLKEEFGCVFGEASMEARRPFCNSLIDMCRNRDLHTRARELLHLGSLYGLYPDLQNRSADEWCLNVQFLSIGAAFTAFEEWVGTLRRVVESQEVLPVTFLARTGTGSHKLGLSGALASHLKKLAAPFKRSEENAGCFMATREDLVSWLQSNHTPASISA